MFDEKTAAVKLVDFGVSTALSTISGKKANTFVGTPFFMAPEVINQGHYDDKVHSHSFIYSANVLVSEQGDVKVADFGVAGQLTETVKKRITFVGSPFWMAPELIKQASYDYKVLFLIPKNPPPQLTGSQWSRSFKEFVEMCLNKDPENRPTASALLKHPFMKKARKNSILIELIERAAEYRSRTGVSSDSDVDEDSDGGGTSNNWEYPTVRGNAIGNGANGTAAAIVEQRDETVRERDRVRPNIRSMHREEDNSPGGTIVKSNSAVHAVAEQLRASSLDSGVGTSSGGSSSGSGGRGSYNANSSQYPGATTITLGSPNGSPNSSMTRTVVAHHSPHHSSSSQMQFTQQQQQQPPHSSHSPSSSSSTSSGSGSGHLRGLDRSMDRDRYGSAAAAGAGQGQGANGASSAERRSSTLYENGGVTGVR
ncbi:hypothetical protein WR25_04140 [Diploscapter pachys]|uniref:Protein kinase domain-containing protein n=1 Tax=Diploscapter pachys TaxID=2018661 RepID=A0A2A2JV31_9BILA|nr:hypothetical protein WR25_04140 [Diploscapter pachys]